MEPLDFVVFKYGFFKTKHYGIVIELFNHTIVLFLSGKNLKILPTRKIEPLFVHKNWLYGKNPAKYELQNNIMNFYIHQPDYFNHMLRELNKKTNPRLTAIYLLTSDQIKYPDNYTDVKIDEQEFFSSMNGYHQSWPK